MKLILSTRILFYFHLLPAVGAAVRAAVARAATKHDAVVRPPVRGRPAVAARAWCSGSLVCRRPAKVARYCTSPSCCAMLLFTTVITTGTGLLLILQ